MIKVMFADLDDSLFQSREKCPSSEGLRPAAFLTDGSPISFTTSKQRDFLSMAMETMTIVPTTARNLNAFRRVDIPFASYAVLDYGGIILAPDGLPDAQWLDEMRLQMTLALPRLQRVMQVMDEYADSCGFKARSRLIKDFDTPFYVVMKDPEKLSARLEQIERQAVSPWLASEGVDFYVHRNGNNLAVLPKSLNKSLAVRRVIQLLSEVHGDIITFGLGDSRSDARFMSLCDYAIVPNGSQLGKLTLESL